MQLGFYEYCGNVCVINKLIFIVLDETCQWNRMQKIILSLSFNSMSVTCNWMVLFSERLRASGGSGGSSSSSVCMKMLNVAIETK